MKKIQWSEDKIVKSLSEGNLGILDQLRDQLSIEAIERIWCRLSELQTSNAFNNLGVLYDLGTGGITRDPERAIECYRQAAALGNYMSCENLGFLYEERLDEKEAIEWWKKGAELRIQHGKLNKTRIFGGRSDDQKCWSRKSLLLVLAAGRVQQ